MYVRVRAPHTYTHTHTERERKRERGRVQVSVLLRLLQFFPSQTFSVFSVMLWMLWVWNATAVGGCCWLTLTSSRNFSTTPRWKSENRYDVSTPWNNTLHRGFVQRTVLTLDVETLNWVWGFLFGYFFCVFFFKIGAESKDDNKVFMQETTRCLVRGLSLVLNDFDLNNDLNPFSIRKVVPLFVWFHPHASGTVYVFYYFELNTVWSWCCIHSHWQSFPFYHSIRGYVWLKFLEMLLLLPLMNCAYPDRHIRWWKMADSIISVMLLKTSSTVIESVVSVYD